ncbi:MAG: YtxH domain-containing protein [Chloroflexota bacterium]
MSENNNDLGAFLAGFVIGGLVGAATALILAPQSGEQTRHQIADKSEDLRSISGERITHYRQLSTEKIQDVQDRATQLLHKSEEEESSASEHIVLDEGNGQTTTPVSEGDETEA